MSSSKQSSEKGASEQEGERIESAPVLPRKPPQKAPRKAKSAGSDSPSIETEAGGDVSPSSAQGENAGPSRIWVDDAVWDALLEAYRDRPGDATFAAAHANTSRATALAAWDRGFTKRGVQPRPPITDVLRGEIEAARAARTREEADLLNQEELRKLQAKRDAIEARKEEMQLAKVSRRNALLVAVATNRLGVLSDRIASEMQRRLETQLTSMSTEELSRQLRLTAYIARAAGLVVEQALRIERIVAGEPTEWVGLKTDGAGAKDVLSELERLSSALESQVKGTRDIVLPQLPDLHGGGKRGSA